MSTSWPDPDTTRLLVDLVRTPSPSGAEQEAAAVLERWARAHGLDAVRDDAAVRLAVGGERPGPTLLLASHLDTVPVGEGWSREPLGATIDEGVLHGRGAVDAKGSVAAMAGAALALRRSGGPPRGRVVVLATYGEESARSTMAQALARLGRPDAAVIGEPTSLEPCVAQRGLVVLRLRWSGRAMHAGWATLVAGADNAIDRAARDVVALGALAFEREHPLLGRVSLAVTRIEGGTANNVMPAECTAVLDVRTTPAYAPDEVVERVRATVTAQVELLSSRFLPCATPERSRLLAAVLRARPAGRPFASPTASDWVHLREVDAVKLGPGDSRLSHTAEERIRLDEVTDAAAFYAAIGREYLA